MESFPYFIVFSFCSPTLPGLFGSLIYSAMKTIYLPIFAIFFSSRTGNIFTRRYKQPKETNYRQIEKDILDEVMGPKVSVFFRNEENIFGQGWRLGGDDVATDQIGTNYPVLQRGDADGKSETQPKHKFKYKRKFGASNIANSLQICKMYFLKVYILKCF